MEQEWKEVYNFYKDSKDGFVTKDGYAAIPIGSGKSLVIWYNGEVLKTCRSEKSARTFIKNHGKQPRRGTVFVK
tara:strand:- start:5327 stop:5548 length:222 start_codon:yes stop_codon:yes gene_type:complete